MNLNRQIRTSLNLCEFDPFRLDPLILACAWIGKLPSRRCFCLELILGIEARLDWRLPTQTYTYITRSVLMCVLNVCEKRKSDVLSDVCACGKQKERSRERKNISIY